MEIEARVVAVEADKTLLLTLPADNDDVPLDRTGPVVVWVPVAPRSLSGPFMMGLTTSQGDWTEVDLVKTFDVDEEGFAVWKRLVKVCGKNS